MRVTLNFKVLHNTAIFDIKGDNKTRIRFTQGCFLQCVCVLILAACGWEIQVPLGHREVRNQREAGLSHLSQKQSDIW